MLVTYIFQIFSQKSLLRTLAHLIPKLFCQKALIETISFKSTQKTIYSQVLLFSGNSFFSCLFWSEILQGNQNLKWKEFVEFTKRQNVFTDFKLFSLFWRHDTCICYKEMFPIIFNIYDTSIISSKFKINKTLFDFCEIDYTLSITVPECRVIWLQYIFNFSFLEISEGNLT